MLPYEAYLIWLEPLEATQAEVLQHGEPSKRRHMPRRIRYEQVVDDLRD